MITLLSPAKTLDFESAIVDCRDSQPEFLDQAGELIEILRQMSSTEVSALMGISDRLGALNAARYRAWRRQHRLDSARPALLAFKGDVYQGLRADTLDAGDLEWAQDHLRVLSGLYGLLRPLDLIQPYRLEMSTRLANSQGPDLYRFWSRRVTDSLNLELARQPVPVVVNLASAEYFRAVDRRGLRGEVVTPVFRDWKTDRYRTISFHAKRARGAMAGFLVRHRLDRPDQLKAFTGGGYRFDPALSTASEWLFTRDSEEPIE